MRILLIALGAIAAAIYAVIRFFFPPRERIDWRKISKPGRVIDVDGEGIHYVEQGRGPPLILVHGFGGHTFSFRYQVPEFAGDHRVVAVDLLGFGYSERPRKADYSHRAQAWRIVRLMDTLGIDRAPIVGHSMGGAVAMRLAADYPQRVEKLVLLASASGDKVVHLPTLPIAKPLISLFARALGRRVLKASYYDQSKLTDAVWEGYQRPARIRGATDALIKMLNDFRKEEPIPYDRIKAPVLIVLPSHEKIVPKWMQDRLRKRFPDAEVRVIDRAGHLLQEERPEAVNAVIRGFLEDRRRAVREAEREVVDTARAGI